LAKVLIRRKMMIIIMRILRMTLDFLVWLLNQ